MRCLGRGAGVWLLLLTSLFFLVSCGIPTFINLDSDIELERVGSPALPQTVEASITLSSSSETLSKLTEYYDSGEGPSLKLFYVISSSPSTVLTNYVSESGISYQISQIETDFRNLIKTTSGSGIPWNVQNTDKAPGFYVYNAPGTTTVREKSLERPQEIDLDALFSGVLIGTFAQYPNESTSFSSYSFGIHPEMDIPITQVPGTTQTLAISLHPVAGENVNILKLTYDSQELYLIDYMRKGFPDNTWTAEEIGEQYVEEDEVFYGELGTRLYVDSGLYIHLFCAIYGGEGNFTNIYWSDLTYLGNIELISD